MEYAIKEIARVIGAKTNQLLDDTVSLLLTDSRRLSFPEKSLFFALKTKTNDGHRYIQELYKLRVRNFVVSDMLPEFESMKDANFLIVKDTLRALQKLATHHRKQFNIPVIGITGSNGKTIVKEFLYQLLHNEFNIVRSPRSYNSQLGVPLSVWQMSEKNTLGIFEALYLTTGRDRTPATHYRPHDRYHHEYRGGSSREFPLLQSEMYGEADAFQ